MKTAKIIASTMGVILTTSLLHADDRPAWRSAFDLTRANLDTFTMTLMRDGSEAGSMTYGWEVKNGHYRIHDRSEMQPNILETAEALIDRDSLLPEMLSIDFTIGANRMDIDAAWQNGQATGQLVTTRDGQQQARPIADDASQVAPLRLAVIGLVAALPLGPDFKVTLPWFNSMANRTEQVTLEVTGEQMVETPAGTFDSWQVAIKGGTPENIAYVSKTRPQRIVRIDVVGQPMHFLLTKTGS
ncbi:MULTISPECIES: hypothetical protein [Kordiimonas]|jgi:hypothetical protein|uniref:DUF3108 domain-containing protein n=1 Tax=Kordiimonas TaxID=288021 RepID=UPI002579E51C|nr:hypothetical protein [Kordiimonas sp. UBA4487]